MAQLHHLVITTECLNKRVAQFQTQFGFRVFAHRTRTNKTTTESSVAMSCHSIVLVVVEKSPSSTCYCEGVTDVAWHVPDIDRVHQTVVSSGATITSPLQRSRSQPSEFSSFTIQSPFPSVQHTMRQWSMSPWTLLQQLINPVFLGLCPVGEAPVISALQDPLHHQQTHSVDHRISCFRSRHLLYHDNTELAFPTGQANVT